MVGTKNNHWFLNFKKSLSVNLQQKLTVMVGFVFAHGQKCFENQIRCLFNMRSRKICDLQSKIVLSLECAEMSIPEITGRESFCLINFWRLSYTVFLNAFSKCRHIKKVMINASKHKSQIWISPKRLRFSKNVLYKRSLKFHLVYNRFNLKRLWSKLQTLRIAVFGQFWLKFDVFNNFWST